MKLESEVEVLLALDESKGNIEYAAQTLGVSHVTLWRYLKANFPDKVPSRRPKADPLEVPDDVCLVIYREAVLSKIDRNVLQDKYNFSERVLRKCIQRGRKLNDALTQSRTGRSF